MAKLQFGDHIDFSRATLTHIDGIQEVVAVKYDTIDEAWTVVAQQDATHMLIIMRDSYMSKEKYIMFEIGKCENIYLLADAIVD